MFNLIEYLYLKQDKNLVYFDCLTGCKSRMYYDRVAKVKYHGCEVDVAFVDVDNLKQVNDSLGHSHGNRYLKAIAEQLRQIRGAKDICRIGGDEFVLIGNLSAADFEDIANISYGIYTKEVYEDMSSAVSKADHDMYLCKSSKKK